MLVFLNGQIIKEEEAKIGVNDLSYQFGYGLFETIKCEQGMPLFFESHYKRLTHSAKELGMPFPVEQEEVKKWIKEVLSANKLTSGRVKIIISKRLEEKFNVLVDGFRRETKFNCCKRDMDQYDCKWRRPRSACGKAELDPGFRRS